MDAGKRSAVFCRSRRAEVDARSFENLFRVGAERGLVADPPISSPACRPAVGSATVALAIRHARLVREALRPARARRRGVGLRLAVGSRSRTPSKRGDLPFRVDLVEWATASPRFRQIILAEHEVLQPAPSDSRDSQPRFAPAAVQR